MSNPNLNTLNITPSVSSTNVSTGSDSGVIKPVLNLKPFTKIFYNNDWHDAIKGGKMSTRNPATEEKICEIDIGGQEDIDEAVESAYMAFKPRSLWRGVTPARRAALMMRLADLMMENTSLLASLESLDAGKPFKEAVTETLHATETLRYYAGWCDKLTGQTLPGTGTCNGLGFVSFTKREPIGVVAAILPHTHPIVMFINVMAPAIAVGCTVVIKPAEETTLTSLYLAHLLKQSGFPPGVLSVVPSLGDVANKALAIHPKVALLSYAGTAKIGKEIHKAANESSINKSILLEIIGQSPTIIFDDVDVDFAVQKAQDAAFANQGQSKTARNRTYVQETIYEDFVIKSRDRALKLVTDALGDPFDTNKSFGPQISERSCDQLCDQIEMGIEQGAILEVGGHRIDGKGYFMQPTVFSEVTDTMSITSEEILGPVQLISCFKTADEVIERINASLDTTYISSAGVLTNDVSRILMIASALRIKNICTNCYSALHENCSFGSGFNSTGSSCPPGGDASLTPFTQIKTITISTL